MEGRKTNCHRDTYKRAKSGAEERGRIVIKLYYEWLVSFMLGSVLYVFCIVFISFTSFTGNKLLSSVQVA